MTLKLKMFGLWARPMTVGFMWQPSLSFSPLLCNWLVPLFVQRAPLWTRCWHLSNEAVSTWGRRSFGSWPLTQTTTATTSWLRSGRASGWERYGHVRSRSATSRASPTRPTLWPAASTRLWGESKRLRQSRSLRMKAFHALTGKTSLCYWRIFFFTLTVQKEMCKKKRPKSSWG